jgi:hypothetical protein
VSVFLTHFAHLRTQLALMEKDIGLGGLSGEEIDLLCAVVEVAGFRDAASVPKLREHPLCLRLTKPTFYRALSRLMEKRFLHKEGGERSGRYRIDPEHLESERPPHLPLS